MLETSWLVYGLVALPIYFDVSAHNLCHCKSWVPCSGPKALLYLVIWDFWELGIMLEVYSTRDNEWQTHFQLCFRYQILEDLEGFKKCKGRSVWRLPPLKSLVWIMCKLSYRVLCVNLPWMQNPVKLSKNFFWLLLLQIGNGGRWRWNYKEPNSNFPREASKLLGNALNIYLFKRLLDLRKKKTPKKDMEKTWIKLSLIHCHNLSRKLIHAPTGS